MEFHHPFRLASRSTIQMDTDTLDDSASTPSARFTAHTNRDQNGLTHIEPGKVKSSHILFHQNQRDGKILVTRVIFVFWLLCVFFTNHEAKSPTCNNHRNADGNRRVEDNHENRRVSRSPGRCHHLSQATCNPFPYSGSGRQQS